MAVFILSESLYSYHAISLVMVLGGIYLAEKHKPAPNKTPDKSGTGMKTMIDTRNFYIDGAWVAPLEGTDLPVFNPATEEPYATISLGGAADAEAASRRRVGHSRPGR